MFELLISVTLLPVYSKRSVNKASGMTEKLNQTAQEFYVINPRTDYLRAVLRKSNPFAVTRFFRAEA